jgi:hypothetical protein
MPSHFGTLAGLEFCAFQRFSGAFMKTVFVLLLTTALASVSFAKTSSEASQNRVLDSRELLSLSQTPAGTSVSFVLDAVVPAKTDRFRLTPDYIGLRCGLYFQSAEQDRSIRGSLVIEISKIQTPDKLRSRGDGLGLGAVYPVAGRIVLNNVERTDMSVICDGSPDLKFKNFRSALEEAGAKVTLPALPSI